MFHNSPFRSFQSVVPFQTLTPIQGLCRFCNNQGIVHNICACQPPNNQAHAQCLIRAINNTVSSHCVYCGQSYRGVLVTFNRPSCREWIRRDERAKYDLIVVPLIVLFAYYLAFLGYLNYITNYGSLNTLLQFILINFVTFILMSSIISTLLAIIKIFFDIDDWRRRNTDAIIVPMFSNGQ
uniref:RING-CH-type domain-containing protein n=1 Tax=Tetranychus urticae TaxID=32264 RepID=T1KZS2_TETUR